MLSFLLRRIAAVLPVLLVVSLVVFLILRLAPGDPAAAIAGNNATNEDIDRIREQLGLTKPLFTQFTIWLSGVLQGDLGYSFYLNKPVIGALNGGCIGMGMVIASLCDIRVAAEDAIEALGEGPGPGPG